MEQVERFKYLRSYITRDRRCEKEIRARINLAQNASQKFKSLVTSRAISMGLRKRFMNSPSIYSTFYNKSRFLWYKHETLHVGRTTDFKHFENQGHSRFGLERKLQRFKYKVFQPPSLTLSSQRWRCFRAISHNLSLFYIENSYFIYSNDSQDLFKFTNVFIKLKTLKYAY